MSIRILTLPSKIERVYCLCSEKLKAKKTVEKSGEDLIEYFK